jgi:uncharacterized repeat protein (TIGR04138 family)
MPPTNQPANAPSLQEIVEKLDQYPIDAFCFVQEGLGYTVEKLHGARPAPGVSRHVTGQQLCEGLREFALHNWGMLARTVLRRWNINSTHDFGRIVYAMVESGMMQKTEDDSIDDFRGVYDFRAAFESSYRIEVEPPQKMTPAAEGRP